MTIKKKLADIAEREARKCFHGNVMTVKSNLQPIADLFPEWSLKQWDDKWCAAFVYYCFIEAGYDMPVKYPDEKVRCNFAGCIAWQEWAMLPGNKFYYSNEDEDFYPEKGDIVLYDHVFNNHEHDHIGVVLQNNEHTIEVAEGNINNVSGIIERDKNNHIRGYIRIPDGYYFSGNVLEK